MKKSDFKTAISLVVFIISLGILMGGYQLYMKYMVVDPVKQQLEARPAIDNVTLSKVEGQFEVTLQLKDVDNLQKEYQAIQETLDNTLKKGSYTLLITDPQDEVLQEAYLSLQPAIYEAAANHSFVWLDQTLSQYATQNGISYNLYVDQRYLYLHLADGVNNMYRVIELTQSKNIT